MTPASASALDKEISGGTKQKQLQLLVNQLLNVPLKRHQKVVFDRGGYLYHGRVQALAEAARENGLEF